MRPTAPIAAPMVTQPEQIPLLHRLGEPHGAGLCRDVAHAVAAALGTSHRDAHYQYVPRVNPGNGDPILGPRALFLGFRAALHRVDIAVVWDLPRQGPSYALSVNARPVLFRVAEQGPPARILASAALKAIVWDALVPGGLDPATRSITGPFPPAALPGAIVLPAPISPQPIAEVP